MLDGAPNFRDLGGARCDGGRVLRTGRLLRSGQLSALTPADIERVAHYRVGLVCDLRTPRERAAAPTGWPAPQTARTLLAPRRDADDDRIDAARPDAWLLRLDDAAFDERAARAWMLDGYRAMPNAYAGVLAGLLSHLADDDGDTAALVHCVAGKDRTGFVCAMLLHALGAARDAIVADYLASVPPRAPAAVEQINADAADAQRRRRVVGVITGVDPGFLDAAVSQIVRVHGSVDRYLFEAAGLDDARRARLHGRLLRAA